MDQGVSPTLRLWQLAEAIRGFRDREGLTIEVAAERLKPLGKRWSKSKVQRIETRLYVPKPQEVEHLATAYGLSKSDAANLVQMSKDARTKGWWQSSALPKQFHTLIGLEREATTLRQFDLALVPGLLQTSDYARALISAIEPDTPADLLENLVAARMIRQHVLGSDHAPEFKVILSEAVLRCPVGGRRVMRGQIERLLEPSQKGTVTIQVLPFSVGAHPGLESGFAVLTLPQLANDVGYVEGVMGGIYLESQDDVRRCVMRFAAMRDRALSPSESTEFISSILAEYT